MVSKRRGTPMGMGAGLQPPRLGRAHPSGELPRPSKGPQGPQDGAWGTCPGPPRPRSCAGPERLPRGHLSSPRPTAAGVGGSLGPRPSLDWHGQAQEPASPEPWLPSGSLCPGQDCLQHRARPASQRCPQVSTGQRPAPPPAAPRGLPTRLWSAQDSMHTTWHGGTGTQRPPTQADSGCHSPLDRRGRVSL